MTIQIDGGAVVSTVALRLELARRAAGYTQLQLAEAIQMSDGTVKRYESGRVKAKRPIIAAWAMATGVSAKWLETGIAPTNDGEGDGLVRPKGFEPLTFWLGVSAGQRHLSVVPYLDEAAA